MNTGKKTAFADDVGEEEVELAGGVEYSTNSGGDGQSVTSTGHSVNTVTKEHPSSGRFGGLICEHLSFWTVVRVLAFWGLLAGTIYVGLDTMAYASERDVDAMEDSVSLQTTQWIRSLHF